MKVLHIGKLGNVERYTGKHPFAQTVEKIYEAPIGLTDEEYLAVGSDADAIIADAIGKVSGTLIAQMPNLKIIHSEGVAFNSIDIPAATERNIYVCNSQGMNASAVAEQTILLMVGMLRGVVTGDRCVREGRQQTVKENYMRDGNLKELSDCTIGLIGFGDIAKAVSILLRAYGVENIYYYKRSPLPPQEEETYGVTYASLDEVLGNSDIVSLHLPVNIHTTGMVDDHFFSRMKDGSYLVNTARGELVQDDALIRAMESGKLAMAGLDTLDREPVQKNHPLLQISDELSDRILMSPHIGGITASSFRRSYQMIWDDLQAVSEGRQPKRVVNDVLK